MEPAACHASSPLLAAFSLLPGDRSGRVTALIGHNVVPEMMLRWQVGWLSGSLHGGEAGMNENTGGLR
jgi:hypothetical protein